MNIKKSFVVGSLLLMLALVGGAGCEAGPEPTGPLSADNINLIFVLSPDLANDPLGDVNPATANLNNQGLQRSLLMGSYLKEQLAGDRQRYQHFRARADDPSANRKQLPGHGGNRIYSAVRPSQPNDHSGRNRQQLPTQHGLWAGINPRRGC